MQPGGSRQRIAHMLLTKRAYNESKCDIVALYATSFIQATRVHISVVPFYRNNQPYFLCNKKKKKKEKETKSATPGGLESSVNRIRTFYPEFS